MAQTQATIALALMFLISFAFFLVQFHITTPIAKRHHEYNPFLRIVDQLNEDTVKQTRSENHKHFAPEVPIDIPLALLQNKDALDAQFGPAVNQQIEEGLLPPPHFVKSFKDNPPIGGETTHSTNLEVSSTQLITTYEDLQTADFVLVKNTASNLWLSAMQLGQSTPEEKAKFAEKVWDLDYVPQWGAFTLQAHSLSFLARNHWKGISLSATKPSRYASFSINFIKDGVAVIQALRDQEYLVYDKNHARALTPHGASSSDPKTHFEFYRVTHCKSQRECWGSLYTTQPVPPPAPIPFMLVTSPKDMSIQTEKQVTNQRRVFSDWSLLPHGQPLILTSDEMTSAEAHSYNMLADKEYEKHHSYDNQPTYRGTFKRAFELSNGAEVVAFSNADIMYTSDLSDTISAVMTFAETHKQNDVLIIGQRVNYDGRPSDPVEFSRLKNNGKWEDAIKTMASRGDEFQENAQDYFIVSKSLWKKVSGNMPDFVIGGVAFDNWFVSRCIDKGYFVVDSTQSLTALHLNHGKHRKEARNQPKSVYNTKLAMQHGGWSHGHVTHANWFTLYHPWDKAIHVWKRRAKLLTP